jgi:hypothetical protein
MTDENQPTAVALELLRDPLTALLGRIDSDEFTTLQLIEVIPEDPPTSEAYATALALWPRNERLGKMIVHGQVIPQLLRESGVVEWAGFAHGEEDAYAVPAWWRRVQPATP